MDIDIKSIKTLDDLKVVMEYYGCNFKLSNGQYKSNCIFHQEKTASLYLSVKNGQAFYKCFGCNEQGDIINVIQIKEGLSTIEAIKRAYEILGKQCSLKPSKIDKLINYIETNKFYKLDGFRIEKVYVYMLDEDKPSFLKIKYRNLTDKSIKDLRTYKVIDAGEYYKTATKAKGGEYEHTIYNYPKVKKAIEKGNNIYFVEGEKDADNLQKLGLTATTIYTKTWKEIYSKQLEGAKIVFIGDTGEAGESFKQLVYKNLNNIVPSFKIIDLPGIEELGDNKDVSDWLEVDGNDKAKLIDAIKNGWDLKISDKWIDVDIKTTKDTLIVTPKKTLRNFELMLKRANTSIFFNEVSKQLEIKTDKFDNKNLNTFATEIYSHCQTEGLKLNQNEVLKFIDAVGYKMQINPFKTYLDSLKDKWDGKSRLNDFYNIFTTPEYFDDELKEIILKKWLLQFIGSAYDTNFKSPGLVVMKGRQGLGKTSIFKNLIPINEDWTFLEEQHFTGDRDNIQTITSNQLVEFSEFARSNKAVDALKAFITSPTDKMVLKYDKHPVQYKRKTVYYATVNDSEFLLDDENRRFWVIELIDINLNHNIDFNQLWAEMYHIYHKQNIKNYWLNQEEQEIIEKNNQNYKFKGELETLIDNSFDFMYSKRIWLTSSEVAQIVGGKHGSTKITRCLKSMGIEQKNINNKDIPRGRYNSMPIPIMWGKDIPSRYIKRIVSPLSEVKNLDEKDKLLQEQLEEIKNLKQHIKYLETKLSEVYTQLEII